MIFSLVVSFNRQQKSPYSFLNISISIRTDNLYLINNKTIKIMFAQQQTQQLVGSARTRVVSSRYVFTIYEYERRKRDLIRSLNSFFFQF